MSFDDKVPPPAFRSPTALPASSVEATLWQEHNRRWWEQHPMRYDWGEAVEHPVGSREFYEEVDRRFFQNAREFMPWTRRPFDALIDFGRLATEDVLEIGVGAGSHARLLAESARSFTGIDLTETAVATTRQRFTMMGLPAERIVRMDAESLQFPSESFDFIWSWGVIHHSANTPQILREMARVLRPGGRAVTMVYHRNPWNWYVVGGLFHGVLAGGFRDHRTLHEVIQSRTDGGLARYYTAAEWRRLVGSSFDVERIAVYGSKAELLPIPAGRVKRTLLSMIPDRLARSLTNGARLGGFLVSVLRKPSR